MTQNSREQKKTWEFLRETRERFLMWSDSGWIEWGWRMVGLEVQFVHKIENGRNGWRLESFWKHLSKVSARLTHRVEASATHRKHFQEIPGTMQKDHSALCKCFLLLTDSELLVRHILLFLANVWKRLIFEYQIFSKRPLHEGLCCFAAFEGLEKASYDWCLQRRSVNKNIWSCRWLQSCSW